MKYVLLLSLAVLFAACGNEANRSTDSSQSDAEVTHMSDDGHNHDHDGHDHGDHDHGDHDHSADQENQGDGVHFGEVIDESNTMGMEEVINKLNKGEEEVEVKVVAMVEEVCQAKGCWMNVRDPNSEAGTSMFVQFKDYGFFMPKDLAGSKVVMKGKAYKAVTPVDELRHFAEDAGASEEEIEAITEPKEEIKFMASGVKKL